MNLPKLFFLISLLLFGSIGVLALLKREAQRQTTAIEEAYVVSQSGEKSALQHAAAMGPPLGESAEVVDIADLQPPQKKTISEGYAGQAARRIAASMSAFDVDPVPSSTSSASTENGMQSDPSASAQPSLIIEHDDEPNSIQVLFEKPSRCPIVETIRYKSRVAWKPKRAAWLIDYANYYKTPLDFIYRSAQRGNSSSSAPVQAVEGMEFNVLRRDIDFHFYMVISFASSRLRLYYILPHEKKAVFLKSYPVCLGRRDDTKSSGSLTPFGLYQLGLKVATYQPHVMGPYKGRRIEMIQVFGTRWIPFEREVDVDACTEPAKGFGIHGTPMRRLDDGTLVEDSSSIGKFESDGCIRLSKRDIEEVYSIISMRKAYVEIVPDFTRSRLMKGEI